MGENRFSLNCMEEPRRLEIEEFSYKILEWDFK